MGTENTQQHPLTGMTIEEIPGPAPLDALASDDAAFDALARAIAAAIRERRCRRADGEAER